MKDKEGKWFIKIPRFMQPALFVDEELNITNNIKQSKFFDTKEDVERFISELTIDNPDKLRIVQYKNDYVVGEDVIENLKVLEKKEVK